MSGGIQFFIYEKVCLTVHVAVADVAYTPLLHSISTGDASAVVIKYAPGVCWVENGCDVAAGAAYEL